MSNLLYNKKGSVTALGVIFFGIIVVVLISLMDQGSQLKSINVTNETQPVTIIEQHIYSSGLNVDNSADVKWSKIGNNVVLTTPSDTVSIGTTKSREKVTIDGNLDVNGSIRATGYFGQSPFTVFFEEGEEGAEEDIRVMYVNSTHVVFDESTIFRLSGIELQSELYEVEIFESNRTRNIFTAKSDFSAITNYNGTGYLTARNDNHDPYANTMNVLANALGIPFGMIKHNYNYPGGPNLAQIGNLGGGLDIVISDFLPFGAGAINLGYFGAAEVLGDLSTKDFVLNKTFVLTINKHLMTVWKNLLLDNSNMTINNGNIDVNGSGNITKHLNVEGNITGNFIRGEMAFYEDSGFTVDLVAVDQFVNITNFQEVYSNGVTYLNNSLIIQKTGWYDLSYDVSYEDGNKQDTIIGLTVNNQLINNTITLNTAPINLKSTLSKSGKTIYLNKGDYLNLQISMIDIPISDPTIYVAGVTITLIGT